MLGIPTRSEVKDQDYQRAVYLDGLRHRIDLSMPFDNVFAQGDARDVVESIDEKVTQFLSLLDEAERAGALNTKVAYDTSTHPNDSVIGRAASNKVQIKPKRTLRTANPLEYSLKFNPVEIARDEAEDFMAEARKVVSGFVAINKFRIKRLEGIINSFKYSANKRFFGINSLMKRSKTPWDFEKDETTEAYRLSQEHKKIKEASDGMLRFDESYFDIATAGNTDISIPAKEVIWGKDILTWRSLSFRQHMRDCFDEIGVKKGQFIFNGVTYTRSERTFYTASHKPPKQIVDVLGEPVVVKGRTFLPERWAEREVELVDRFRAGYDDLAQQIAGMYEGFVEEGESAQDEQVIRKVELALIARKAA